MDLLRRKQYREAAVAFEDRLYPVAAEAIERSKTLRLL